MSALAFGPFRLDPEVGMLERGSLPVALTPRAYALLQYLVERPGRLVSKDELLGAVWAGAYVGDEVLKVRIAELRRALEDPAEQPRYIATVHRRGYRFVAAVGPAPAGSASVASAAGPGTVVPLTLPGRAAELARLGQALSAADRGERRVVFVSGEPGIGKTALVDAFVAAAAGAEVGVARGQCLELHGAGESYLPVLDALARLARGRRGALLATTLRRLAPTWLLQLPSLLEPDEREALRGELAGVTTERMLREMAEALEALTAEATLVLVLEDLHWSDVSTLDLLSFLARRRESARLLVLGTYRPEAVVATRHPLASLPHDLQARGAAIELPLAALDEAAVGEILAARLLDPPARLTRLIHRRTEGLPLFVVSVIEDLAQANRLTLLAASLRETSAPAPTELDTPAGLRALLDQQLDLLDAADRRLLEAASVAGEKFSTAALAMLQQAGLEEIDERCADLARRRRFLRPAQAGSTTDYGFVHALHRETLYGRVAPTRRARLHALVADWTERTLGEHAAEHAAELAHHLERAGQPARALTYVLAAARQAAARFASHEVLLHARHGLGLLAHLPEDPARKGFELELQILRGTALRSTQGYADPEVAEAFGRAGELARATGDNPELYPVLSGLFGFYLLRAELATAAELAEELLRLAELAPQFRADAHLWAGIYRVNVGEFAVAHRHLAAAMALGETADRAATRVLFGRDVVITAASFDAWALWSLGFEERARVQVGGAVADARALGEPQTLAFALFFSAFVSQLLADGAATGAHADELAALAATHGFRQWRAFARILRGWALDQQGDDAAGEAEMRSGLDEYGAIGAEVSLPHFTALLAGCVARAGRGAEAATLLERAAAAAERTGGGYYLAEIRRQQALLALQQDPAAAARAETLFKGAVELARRQGGRSFERRVLASWVEWRPSPARRRQLAACRRNLEVPPGLELG